MRKSVDDTDGGDEESFEKIPSRRGRVFRIPDRVTFQSERDSITFYPDGKMDKARIFLCLSERCYTISSQDQSGYIRIFDFKVQ